MEDNLVGAIVKKLNESNGDKSDVFVILAIGPEGGWIPPEVELLEQSGKSFIYQQK